MQDLQELVDGWFGEAGGGPLLPRGSGELRQDGDAVATRPLPPMDLYLFRTSLIEELVAPGAQGFALSFAGHGANSYAWTLWHSRPNLRFCVQVHGGGAYAAPESTAREMAGLVELYEQSVLLCQEVQGDLVVVGSTFRGGVGVDVVPSGDVVDPHRRRGSSTALFGELAEERGLHSWHLSPWWVRLRRQLTVGVESVLGEQSSDVLQLTDERYLQWAAWPDGLQIEASSNRFLEDEPLGFVTRRGLGLHDWERPRPPDLPNFWRRFDAPVDVDACVDALMSAARVLAPQPLPEADVASRAPESDGNSAASTRRGRRILLVPVLKCGFDFLAAVADDLAFGAPDVDDGVCYLDVAGALLSEGRLTFPYADVRKAAPLEPGELRLVDAGELTADRRVPALLAAAGGLLQTVDDVAARGDHVVVLGPRLLPGPALNVYRALAGSGFDVVVLLVSGFGPEEISLEADLTTELIGCTWRAEGPPVVVAGDVPPAAEWPGELSPRIVAVVPWTTRELSTSPDMPWLGEVWRRAHEPRS